jgi:tetratricopeptide (TPR) repeat protein
MWLIISLFFSIFPWSSGSKNAQGNALYQQGKYAEAAASYREAQAEAPDNPALPYNLGNALYRQEKYAEAIQAYKQAVNGKDPINARALYNLGNSLYRTGRLQESVEAYKQGLRITPDDIDMKYNLEFVQRQLQQQQQPPDEAQNDGPQNQPQDRQEESRSRQNPEQSPSSGREKENDRTGQPPREGELSREEAERLLNALNQDEQDLQKQLRKQAPMQQKNPEKDW